MNSKPTAVEELFEKVTDYSKTSFELFKLTAIEKSADIGSSLLCKLITLTTVVLSFIILSIALALYLGELCGKSSYGFFIVGLFYAFVALLLYVFRLQWLKQPLNNAIIKHLLKQKQ